LPYSYPNNLAAPNPATYYRQNSIMTAAPERLVVMAYDGLLRFLSQARAAIELDNKQEMTNCLGRAQDIITELTVSLDLNYEISGNLFALYNYMFSRVVSANLDMDKSVIDEVENLTKGLRGAWAEAAEKCAADRSRTATGLVMERA